MRRAAVPWASQSWNPSPSSHRLNPRFFPRALKMAPLTKLLVYTGDTHLVSCHSCLYSCMKGGAASKHLHKSVPYDICTIHKSSEDLVISSWIGQHCFSHEPKFRSVVLQKIMFGIKKTWNIDLDQGNATFNFDGNENETMMDFTCQCQLTLCKLTGLFSSM